jgi:hypothetical protein
MTLKMIASVGATLAVAQALSWATAIMGVCHTPLRPTHINRNLIASLRGTKQSIHIIAATKSLIITNAGCAPQHSQILNSQLIYLSLQLKFKTSSIWHAI